MKTDLGVQDGRVESDGGGSDGIVLALDNSANLVWSDARR